MNLYGISEKTFNLLMETFALFPEITQVVLFGSRAKGNYRNGSDIDLAVKGKNINPGLIFKLKRILNAQLPIPYHVDVVDFGNLDHKELKKHIITSGKLLYGKAR